MKVIVVEFYLFIDERKRFDKLISIITMIKPLPIIIWVNIPEANSAML